MKVTSYIESRQQEFSGTYGGKDIKPNVDFIISDEKPSDVEVKSREKILKTLGKIPEADAKAYLTHRWFSPQWMHVSSPSTELTPAAGAVQPDPPVDQPTATMADVLDVVAPPEDAPATDVPQAPAPKKRGRHKVTDPS